MSKIFEFHKVNHKNTPLLLPLILVLVEISAPWKLLEIYNNKQTPNKTRSVPISNTEGGRYWRCFDSLTLGQTIGVQEITAAHPSLPSSLPSCGARDDCSWSDPHRSSTEPLEVTLSSWLTTSWFRLLGSDNHVTSRPSTEENQHTNPTNSVCHDTNTHNRNEKLTSDNICNVI